MGFQNNILTAPFTKIAANGNGDLQKAIGSSSLSQYDLMVTNENKFNKWARYKRTCDDRYPMDNHAFTSRSVSYGPYSYVGNAENAAGSLNGEVSVPSAYATSGIVFWRIWGLYIPVLRTNGSFDGKSAANIKTAIDTMNAHKADLDWPLIPYSAYPANYKALRAMDFNGYKKTVTPPFYYEASNGYSDEGPTFKFYYNNVEEATHCINFSYLYQFLGNPTTLHPCVIIYPSGGYDPIISDYGSDFSDPEYAQWTAGVLSMGTSSGRDCQAYFCLRDETNGVTILPPVGIEGCPNPITFKAYNNNNPQSDPFSYISCDTYSDTNNVERYTRNSGTAVTIQDVYDAYKGLYTNGTIALKLKFINNSSKSRSINLSLVTFFFGFRNATYAYTAYNQSGTAISGTTQTIAAGSSTIITFEFSDIVRSSDGLISEGNGNADVTLRYNNTDEFTFAIRYQYTTNTSLVGTAFVEGA